MKVRVNYAGSLRTRFNTPCEELQLSDEASLRTLLLRLNERYGETLKAFVFDNAAVWVRTEGIEENLIEGEEWIALVRINGTPSHQLQGLDTKLEDGDRVDLTLLFSGGG